MLLPEADRRLAEYDGDRGYDPRPLLRRLDTPILWLFGERDDVIPTNACLAEIAALRAERATATTTCTSSPTPTTTSARPAATASCSSP